VDDGKSTLIGRLLYDTKSIFEDQLEAIDQASRRRGEDMNLALLTDGLRAEREQNITIDVAYRYFATPRRKFIIADTPGHVQYTRNMVTGASTAELAIVLVDARKGVLTQSKRHGFIASLLRIPHVVVAVNKMDLVGHDQGVFTRIVDAYQEFAEKLDVRNLVFIPISALNGDNVVDRSAAMPWYSGPTLLYHLETVNVGADRNLVDFRFPVQTVIRPHQDFRGFAGRIASGTIGPGEEVVVLPSGRTSRIRAVTTPNGTAAEAAEGEPVVLTIEDDIDIARGDMIVRTMNVPVVGRRFDATVCWLSDTPLDPRASYVLRHTTRTVRADVSRLHYRINVDTLHRERAETLGLNEIGRVEITTALPVFFDPYSRNRETGSFILVDAFSNATVAAGMIRGEVRTAETLFEAAAERRAGVSPRTAVSPNVVWRDWNVSREEREARNGHRAAVVWLTGLSGSGKSTIATLVERHLYAAGCQTMLLDGDQLRHGLNGDLGFAPEDRRENVRRAGEVARLFFEQGAIVLCAFVSPYRADRARVREIIPDGRFFEIFVECDVEECRRRDPKGLYRDAGAARIPDLTGVAAPYEAPERPELIARTEVETAEALAAKVVQLLYDAGITAGRSSPESP
jgi:bifunctional enzyme CysN/CysC